MCTAVTYQSNAFYFGRTLDYEHGFGERVVITPRQFPLTFRHMGRLDRHYAIIGMACVAEGYPLYFDGINEKGLGMAGLNFVGNAHYRQPLSGRDNVAGFEFISWILGQCASVKEAVAKMKKVNLTGESFSRDYPPAELHWMVADREEAVTVEPAEEGLRIYPNPVGVLTNNPPFDEQLFRLNDYMGLSPETPENRFSGQVCLKAYSRGMGALGLPGDLSSQSRFVRAAFVKLNSPARKTEGESVGQFFHILGSVEQTLGCCEVEGGEYEITRYTSCCNGDRGIYYYTTYGNHRITAVDMHREALDGNSLCCYPLVQGEQIHRLNG